VLERTVHGGTERGNLDHPQFDDACVCGSTDAEAMIGCATGIDLGDVGGVGKIYPYYDRGLARHVRSAAHRRQLCQELGVQPVDGDDDTCVRQAQREDTRVKDMRARIARNEAEMWDSPDGREFRRLQDRGAFADRMRRPDAG
jgi:hypothetical protein